jgi:hypothetical protein
MKQMLDTPNKASQDILSEGLTLHVISKEELAW